MPDAPDTEVDLFVIGGGSGGVRAARIAAGHGARVMLAEQDRVGGTCVIRGCVPKKLWVMASRVAEALDDAAPYGWSLPPGDRTFDWAGFRQRVSDEVGRLEGVYRATLGRAGVTLVDERAELAGEHRVRLCGSGRIVRARHVLVATGSRPALPPLPGAERAATSDDFFRWTVQPRRVLVQGAGYIGLELGCLLQRLGSSVTLLSRGAGILRGFDGEVARHLHAELSEQGLDIRTGIDLVAIEPGADGAGCVARLSDGSGLAVDAVLRAVGRTPNADGLGLEALGVARRDDGTIAVDRWSATSVPWIHAVGDVTGRLALTPAAIREGHAFADTVFGGRPTAVDLSCAPTAVFTTPEVGTVGLTEAQAAARHGALDVYVTTFRPMRSAMAGRPARVLMKLVVERATDRLLGAHIVAPEAAEMIQMLGIAVRAGLTKADVDATLALHPSSAEELVTMRVPTRRVG